MRHSSRLVLVLISLFLIPSFCNVSEAYYATSEMMELFSSYDREIKQGIPHFAPEGLTVDSSIFPGDPSSVIWLCFKSRHILAGYNSEKNNVFLFFPCATGRNIGQKERIGDMRTPEGSFTIKQIQDASYWQPYNDKKTGETIGYGPFFIRLDTGQWKGIGIHGTDSAHEDEIGTNASHGCIRLKNEDLLKVERHAKVGQTIIILP
ncbi:MAG: L,D-transpeptidase [Synergistales bacterium]|nr:L,D-transpeptidase [Synergistales bacterium]